MKMIRLLKPSALVLILPLAAFADSPPPLFPSLPFPPAADSLQAAYEIPSLGLLPFLPPPPNAAKGTAPAITTQPASQSAAPGASVTFTVAATGTPTPVYQWLRNGRFIRGANAATFTISAASVADAGTYVVQVYNGAGFAVSRPATLSVAPAGLVTTAPQSQSIATGATATFSVAATGTGLTYQWQFNGQPISGATSATYVLANAGPGASGVFDVQITKGGSIVADELATLLVTTSARLTNLSARATVGTGNEILIAGFVSAGTGTKQILLRGIGPTLGTAFGVTGVLATPQLTLYDARGRTVAANSTWGGTAALVAAFNAVGAFALPSNSADAALLQTLDAGSYTAQITGANGATGVALAELYDADTGTPTASLVNISARAYVGNGSGILIAGFAVTGTSSETILIRGVGPGLKSYFGFPTSLGGTKVALFDSKNNQITANAGWGNDPWISGTGTQVGAFPLPPGSADSALLVTIPPGSYTVQVTGTAGSNGVGLVEIYEVR